MYHQYKLDVLRAMLADGEFHHATYRNIGTLWEGLFIYRKQDNGFNGFTLAMHFPKESHDEAYDLVRHTGVSVGSRGNG